MTSEALAAPYNGYRRFLPGDCGPGGAAVAAFVEADSITANLSHPAIQLAQMACHGCYFLDQCAAQSQDIRRTLHVMGVDFPVVSGAVAPRDEMSQYMTERERLTAEPHYQFDISGELPDDPLTAATLLRQWMTFQGRLIVGQASEASLKLTQSMMRRTDIRDAVAGLGLSQDNVFDVIMPLSKLLISHERQEDSKSTWRRKPVEEQLDMQAFENLTPLFLTDAAAIRRLGFRKLEIVLYHSADYWQRLIAAYQDSHCIDMNAVLFHCEAAPRYPVSPIEAHIAKNDERRRGTYTNPYRIPKDVREAEVERLAIELAETHPHISRPMLLKLYNTSSNVFAARAKVDALRRPGITDVARRFGDRISSEAMQNFLVHSDEPESDIVAYIGRVDTLTARMLAAGGDIAPSYIEQIAIDRGSANMSGQEVIIATETRRMQLQFRLRCKDLGIKQHVPAWTFKKVVSTYPEEDWWDVLVNLNEMIETETLRPGVLSCALETEAANLDGYLVNSVSEKGEYIGLNVDAQVRVGMTTLEATIQSAKLDLLVFGRRLPTVLEGPTAELPVWLREGETELIAKYVRQGGNAAQILSGTRPIPESILLHYGWPRDESAHGTALSAIRHSALRGNNARRLQLLADRRQRIRAGMQQVYQVQA